MVCENDECDPIECQRRWDDFSSFFKKVFKLETTEKFDAEVACLKQENCTKDLKGILVDIEELPEFVYGLVRSSGSSLRDVYHQMIDEKMKYETEGPEMFFFSFEPEEVPFTYSITIEEHFQTIEEPS